MEDTKPLTRDEWVRRFADRIKEVAEWDESDAMSAALAAADSHERDGRFMAGVPCNVGLAGT